VKSQPEPLSTALHRALPGLNLAQRQKESLAMSIWPEVVGPITAAKTRPLHINRGVLTVQVHSASWAHQLNLFKAQFLSTLAEKVGPRVIQDLRWRIGSLTVEQEDTLPRRTTRERGSPPPTHLPELAPAEELAIASQVKVISDAGLAARMSRMLKTRRRRESWLRQQGWSPCSRCGSLHAQETPPTALCPVCQQQVQQRVTPNSVQ